MLTAKIRHKRTIMPTAKIMQPKHTWKTSMRCTDINWRVQLSSPRKCPNFGFKTIDCISKTIEKMLIK